jgi:hypothetical protein
MVLAVCSFRCHPGGGSPLAGEPLRPLGPGAISAQHTATLDVSVHPIHMRQSVVSSAPALQMFRRFFARPSARLRRQTRLSSIRTARALLHPKPLTAGLLAYVRATLEDARLHCQTHPSTWPTFGSRRLYISQDGWLVAASYPTGAAMTPPPIWRLASSWAALSDPRSAAC